MKKTKEPLVSIITCTGGRPEAFSLCTKYLRRQTYKGPIQWIIVDDSTPETVPPTFDSGVQIDYVRGPVAWRPGLNTHVANLNAALPKIKGDIITFFEDDDFYHPMYLEKLLYLLDKWEAAGCAHNLYYALKDRAWKDWRNLEHASLCSTAFHRSMLPIFEEAVNDGTSPWIDIHFWKKAKEQHRDVCLLWGAYINIGMKQLPGKPGIGAGHRGVADDRFMRDPVFAKLKEWVGEEDAAPYIRLATGQPL